MPANPLFWIVLAVAAIGYVVTLWLLYSGRGDDGGFYTGRTPGYSYTEGHNVGLDESVVDLPGGDWVPVRLETLHGPERSRLVLTIAVDLDPDVDDGVYGFLDDLAEEAQHRSEVDAVFIEADGEFGTSGRWETLYASDGRGWWGSEQVERAHRGPDTSARLE
jgi:hypothetical protein